MGFTSTTTSTGLVGISVAHSVECLDLKSRGPGSIHAWGGLFIPTFPLFPVTVITPVLIINQTTGTDLPATAWGGGGICERSISFPSSKALITLSNCCEQNQSYKY